MTYIKKSKRFGFRFLIYGIVLIISSVFVLANIFFPHFFPSFFNAMAVPFWRAEFSLSSGGLSTEARLIMENESLRRKIMEIEARMALIDYIEQENLLLKSALSFSTSTADILTVVLKRPPISGYDELIIDLGEKQGIKKSDLVFSVANIPIGRVVDVSSNTSKVLLFSSSGDKHDVLIGPNNYPAIAVGRGGGQYEVELPVGLIVNKGDYVSLASVNATPLGKVVFVENGNSSPFQKIIFSSLINIYQLRWVFVKSLDDN